MHSIKIVNRSFEDVALFEHLGTTLTDQNGMNEGIKSRLNSGMLDTIRLSYLLSRNIKAKIYRIIILPVVLYGCETSSLKL
jgi:hypothetical protein